MAYWIKEVVIDGLTLVAVVNIGLSEKDELLVKVPVKEPKAAADVLTAIAQRAAAEQSKFDTHPLMSTIKAELDALIDVKQG